MGKFNVGLQLFSIRDEMEADPRGTLKLVREMGYDCVESAGYCGLSPEDFRAAVEEAGLKLISTHTMLPPTMDGIPAIVREQQTLGVSYMAIPWMNKDRTPGEVNYESTRDMIAAICEAFHGTGLQLLYHNHDFEFDFLGDEHKIDILFRDLPELWPEFDCCWVRFSGEDPVKYIKKYAGKVPVLHLKDFICEGYVKGEPVYELIGDDSTKGNRPKTGFEFRPIGQGCQDIPAILAAAEAAGTHTVIVEQDLATNLSPMESAKASREYLASIGY